MGTALLALALVLGAGRIAPQIAGPAQERDPAWDALVRALGDEFRAAKAARQDPARRAEAEARTLVLVQRLAAATRELAVPLFHETLRLGSDADLTPDLEQRLDWLECAASAARLVRDEPFAARADQERALQLARVGRLGEACAVLDSALRATRIDALRAHLLQDLAEYLRRLGSHGRALERLDELEALLAREPSLGSFRTTVDGIRAYVHLDLGLPDRAAEAIRHRLDRAEANGRRAPEELLAARLAFANWLLAVGDLRRLVEVVGGYLAENAANTDPAPVRAEFRMLLGVAAIELEIEEPEREVEPGEQGAAQLARALESGLAPAQEAFARLSLAEQGLVRGRTAEAARELETARGLLELSGEGGASLPRTTQAIELVTLEARLVLARGDPSAMLAAARERLVAVLEGMLASWAEAPERAGGVGWLLYSKRRALLGEYARLSIALEGEERGASLALERLLSLETLGTLARRGGIAPPTLAEIRRELLDEGRGLLVWLSTRSASHVFALDRAGLVHAPTAPSYTIERVRRAYLAHLLAARADLADPARRAWALELERRLARELAGLLLPAPIRARVAGWRGLTLAGTDSLGPVPFEWLPLDAEPYLGTAFALDVLPSLPLGLAWARRQPHERGPVDLVLLGEARPSAEAAMRWPELEPLALPDELVARLAAPYPAERVRLLRGAEATRRGLGAANLGSVGVLQLLVHGVLDRERERPLTLVLTGDDQDPGLFRCEDAERLDAPRFVLLASCRTAAGPTRKGDPGSADMGGAWLSAGAQAVLLARADLALEDATRISTSLHRSLVRGATPAEAMRAARAEEVVEHGPEAPFHGGLLAVVGLGHRSVFEGGRQEGVPPPAGSTALFVVGVAALLVGLALGLFLRGSRRRSP